MLVVVKGTPVLKGAHVHDKRILLTTKHMNTNGQTFFPVFVTCTH